MPSLLYSSAQNTPKKFLNASESQKTMLKVMDPNVNMRYIEPSAPSDRD